MGSTVTCLKPGSSEIIQINCVNWKWALNVILEPDPVRNITVGCLIHLEEYCTAWLYAKQDSFLLGSLWRPVTVEVG